MQRTNRNGPPLVRLEDAIVFAASAHRGRLYPTDEVGREPFILHPLRVMLRLTGDDERIVAVLHDVVEDAGVTLDDLRRLGLSEAMAHAVDLLTHSGDDPYDVYIDRLAGDGLARRVKLADLADNLEHNVGLEGSDEARVRHEAARRRLLLAEADG